MYTYLFTQIDLIDQRSNNMPIIYREIDFCDNTCRCLYFNTLVLDMLLYIYYILSSNNCIPFYYNLHQPSKLC